MATDTRPVFSFVVPLYNEAAVLARFHANLLETIKAKLNEPYEIIYCDDGSRDDTGRLLRELAATQDTIRIVTLTRNFGKEVATTAGMSVARGAAILTLDADGQHPVELIPQFIERWQAGHKVVIGLRVSNQKEGLVKRYGSKLFYRFFNRLLRVKLIPGATDFRLIDRSVQQEFMRMPERNRVTRGLIDWLGYDQEYIRFHANARIAGDASYSFGKLCKLAFDSIISLSTSPLYLVAYIGGVVLPISLLLGIVMVLDALFGDPFNWHATGGAYVMVFILFLIGVLLVSQGIIGFYLSHIHTETQNRPMFVIDSEKSKGI